MALEDDGTGEIENSGGSVHGKAEAERTFEPAVAPTLGQARAKVLVVDDNPEKLMLLVAEVRQRLCADIGIIGTSNLQIVTLAIRSGVDGVITDFNLGSNFSGRDVAEFAMQHGVPASHILVATGQKEAALSALPQEIRAFEVPHEIMKFRVAITELNLHLRGAIGEA